MTVQNQTLITDIKQLDGNPSIEEITKGLELVKISADKLIKVEGEKSLLIFRMIKLKIRLLTSGPELKKAQR